MDLDRIQILKITRQLYSLLFIIIAGFMLLIYVNHYFNNLSTKIDKQIVQQQQKLIISSFISDDLNIIEAQFFQLAVNGKNKKTIINITKKIKSSTNNIINSLKVLKNGGILKRVIKLNIVGHNSMVKYITYNKRKDDISLVAIDILPKILNTNKMIKDINKLLLLRIKNRDNKKKLSKIIKKIDRSYKILPTYFQRMSENVHRSIYIGYKLLDSIKKEIEVKKKRYLIIWFTLILFILFSVIFLGFIIIKSINKNNKKLIELNKNLKKKDIEIKTIMDSQSSMVIISNGKKIFFANQTLLDFFPDYSNISEFTNDHECICDFFDENIPNNSYIYDKDYDGKNWVEYILSNQDKQFKIIMKKDGVDHHFKISAKESYITTDNTVIIVTLNDITEQIINQELLHKQKKELYHQANYDTLTGLPNRTLLFYKIGSVLETAKRFKFKFAVLFIDLDNFKEINDSLGHDVGDKVLIKVAKRLKKILRSNDTIARLGGDEFIVVLENIKTSQDASFVARNIIKIFSKEIIIDNYTLYANCSIGISIYPNDSININDLLKYADSAMYEAKIDGKSKFKYYDSKMTKLAFKKIMLEADLNKAIENNELTVYFQPQIDASTGEIIGAESLVRWIHPTKGVIAPNDFIPFAESSGLILKIDEFVMRYGIKKFSEWYKEGLAPGILYMNLSTKQLKENNFVEKFKNSIAEMDFNPKQLGLEIVERQIMNDTANSIKKLQVLHDFGIEIAIDDFGTGYSSLSYLKDLPIDKIKIDISFVKNLPDDKDSVAVVKTIISLGKNLNLKLIAEGVETAEQESFLLQHGCKYMQGYYYSKPLSAKDFRDMLYLK